MVKEYVDLTYLDLEEAKEDINYVFFMRIQNRTLEDLIYLCRALDRKQISCCIRPKGHYGQHGNTANVPAKIWY